MFATHYHELNELERNLDHVSTMHAVVVERDRGDIEFTFEMARGGANRSHGIAVANLVGFPRDVTDRADCILKGLENGGDDRGTNDVVLKYRYSSLKCLSTLWNRGTHFGKLNEY